MADALLQAEAGFFRVVYCWSLVNNSMLSSCPSPPKGKQSYDMAYNHYINRKNLAASMPTFSAMVPAWRPGGIDTHFLGWDTLTHGELNAGKK